MRNLLSRYVRMNVAERRGVFALVLLGFTFIGISACINQLEEPPKADLAALAEKSKQFFAQAQPVAELSESFATSPGSAQLSPFDPNTATVQELALLGMPKWLAERIEKYRTKGGQFRKPEDLSKIYGMPAELFAQLEPYVQIEGTQKSEQEDARFASYDSKYPKRETQQQTAAVLTDFDPNTCSEADFIRLGIKPFIAKSILNYRSKGGQYRKPDDFAKVYNLEPEQFQTLRPYIKIVTDVTPVAYSTKPKNLPKNIDINIATLEEWQQLGVAYYTAERIIKFREKMGGFATVQMVAETRGMPDSTFQKIKPFLKPSGIVQKIPINQIEEKTLAMHPLFDSKQSKILVNYRTHHGAYKSVNDMADALPFVDKAWLNRVEPYLQF
jgi:competence protein ComEA